MSVIKRLVNVAWFRVRQTVEGEAPDPRAAALDEELARTRPSPATEPAASEPVESGPAEAPRPPKPRRL